MTSLLRGMGIREWHPEQGFPTAKQMSRMVAAEVEARDEREPQRRRAQDPAQGHSVRRHPRRGDEADRPHTQRPSAQVLELAHAPRGVHGAPAPPHPCRGLTPYLSLNWPAREGGFRFATSRRPLWGQIHPSSRAGLVFGAHQARSLRLKLALQAELKTAMPRVCHLKISESRFRPSPHAFFACGLHNF